MCVTRMIVTTRRSACCLAIRALAAAMAARARAFKSRTLRAKAAYSRDVLAALRLPRGGPAFA
jgi:hypothetical protein